MQKKYIFYYLIVISFNFILSNEADHLVLSKVCISPNKAQMVEIFNPTDSDINLNPEGEFPSMFEPIHGSAFDIMGKNIANPIGAFWSAVMMLNHLGETSAAQTLMNAIERCTLDGTCLPQDLGGAATTEQVTDFILEMIRGSNGSV